MRLNPQLAADVSDELIVRINELYHDLENQLYEDRHAKRLQAERDIFRSLAQKYLTRPDPITCLDYGSGSGLVPLAIGPCLKPEDTLICSDLSDNMLDCCRQNIARRNFPFTTHYRKLDGRLVLAETGSVDVLTVNAVLHHLPDIDRFASECSRVLKKDGVVLVGHEPNGDRRLPFFGRLVRNLTHAIFRPSFVIRGMVDRAAWLERVLRRLSSTVSRSYRKRNRMLADIARQLQEEGLVDRPLRGVEIQQLVDYHTERGFSRERLLGEVFKRFDLLECRTYGHLDRVTHANALTRALDRWMAGVYPSHGENIAFALRRKS